MSTLKSINVQHPSSATINIVNDSSGNVTVGNNLTVTGTVAMASSFKRNRIINGNMLFDQRNAGAVVTPTVGVYTLDRWALNVSAASKVSVQQNAGAVTPPAGFVNYAGLTSTSAYTVAAGDYISFSQAIEGFNVSDLGWGTANAKSVTLSFWVRSSLTGTFGGCVQNGGLNRSYPFSYTISAANTWEQKTVTISGDTTGTWATGNTTGASLLFGIGVGTTYQGTAGAWAATNYVSATGSTNIVATSGATFYITGVQLEVGTKATPYEMQIYSDQLAQCQRYFEKSYDDSVVPGGINNNGQFVWVNQNAQTNVGTAFFKITKRTAPTMTIYSPANGASGNIYNGTSSVSGTLYSTGQGNFVLYPTSAQSLSNLSVQYTASAEL